MEGEVYLKSGNAKMQAKDLHQIAKMLYAMESKRKPAGSYSWRTFSDEYPWVKKSAPRDRIPTEVREQWRKLAEAKA